MSIYKEYKMGIVSESEFREYGRLESEKEKDMWRERKRCLMSATATTIMCVLIGSRGMSEIYIDNSRIYAYGTKPIGFIQIYPNMYLSMTERPCWFHLLMTRLLLGWKWIYADENGCIPNEARQ